MLSRILGTPPAAEQKQVYHGSATELQINIIIHCESVGMPPGRSERDAMLHL